MKKGINEIHSNKTHSQQINNNQSNSLLSKSSNLLELLKAKKGQNINIDISMLSNKGSLTNLIEKAKKYQTPKNSLLDKIAPNNTQKEQITNQNKNQIDNDKSINLKSNSKRHSRIEILEKLNKRKSEKNINKDKNINIDSNQENSEDTNEKSSNKNLNNINPESNDLSPKNIINYNVLSSKTTSSGTIAKSDQISNKEKSDNYEDEDLDSYSSTQKEDSNKKNKRKNNNKRKNYNNKTQKTYNSNFAIEYETVKDNYSIKSCNSVLEYSFREDQNIDSQPIMEDKSKSIENFNNDKSQMIFEIFDGHGGDEMSSYLQANLAKIYKQNLLLNKGNIILSLKNAFHDADDEMREQLNIEGLGSTGTLVHIIKGLGPSLEVYSANVGDSRVSLISPEHIIRLSCDHRTTDEKEKKRILEAGMEIIDDRICGTLMLTRIFGNYEYKEYKEDKENEKENNVGLICEPFISKINIDLNIENQYLILASDGIWDILTEEDIQNIIKKYQDTQKICSVIIKKCLENEAWDNMSVFAVKLT